MRNIEVALKNYDKGIGTKVSDYMICEEKSYSKDELILIIFKFINSNLDEYPENDKNTIKKINEYLSKIKVILENNDNVNRKLVFRKLCKLYEKIDRILEEKEKLFIDYNQAVEELQKIQDEIYNINLNTIKNSPKQYIFIDYLINEIKNLEYVDFTLDKMPYLVSVKDSDNNSIISNIISNYMKALIEHNDEDSLYYYNVISLFFAQEEFNLKHQENEELINMIYKCIDSLSTTKKDVKRNKNEINTLNNLIKLLSGLGENSFDINNIAAKYKIEVDFDETVKTEAQFAKTPDAYNDKDRYIVSDYLISIDKDITNKIDDALSCSILPNGNYLLGVHIASVLGYYPYDSNIINTAISRVKTIRLPYVHSKRANDFYKLISIFPHEFSAQTASLIPNTPKYARSYYFEIDSEANIINQTFYKTIICNNKKSSYNEVDEVLENGSEDKKFENTVFNLENVANILDKRFKPTDLYEKVKENSKDYSDLRVKRIGAEKIVYQVMTLTGNQVANFFYNSNYPCLYRVHEIDEETNLMLQLLIDELNESYGGKRFEKLYRLLDGIYPKGWYATEGKHQGLGLDHYCHCTSTIRRGADIVVEHALEVCYDNNPTDKDLINLQEEIKRREIEINSKLKPMEWFVEDYKRSYQKKR